MAAAINAACPQAVNATADDFGREGYAVFPQAFDEVELALLRQVAAEALAAERPENRRDAAGTPYIAFAAHQFDPLFARLVTLPRLIGPVQAFLGEQVYLHQLRIDAKPGFTPGATPWHQNFALWKDADGMINPRVVNIAIFLDDVSAANGPMLLIPRSHRQDDVDDPYPIWTLDEHRVASLAERGGIVAPLGKAGSMLMFDLNLVHGAAGNIGPYSRTTISIQLAAVSNAITRPSRAAWMAHTDFSAITPASTDRL